MVTLQGTPPESKSLDGIEIPGLKKKSDNTMPTIQHWPLSSGVFGKSNRGSISEWFELHFGEGPTNLETKQNKPPDISQHSGKAVYRHQEEIRESGPSRFEYSDTIIGKAWDISTMSSDGAKRKRFSELIAIASNPGIDDEKKFVDRVTTFAMQLKHAPEDNKGNFHESVCRRGEDGGIRPVMYEGNRMGYFQELLSLVQTRDARKSVSDESYCAMMSGLGHEIRNMPKQEQLQGLVSLLNAAKKHVFESERKHAELLITLTGGIGQLAHWDAGGKSAPTVSLGPLEEAQSLESKMQKDTIALITNVLPRFPYLRELWRAQCALKDQDCKRDVANALKQECKRGEMFSTIDASTLETVYAAMNG